MEVGRAGGLLAVLCMSACGGRARHSGAVSPAGPAAPVFTAPADGACRCDAANSESTCCAEVPPLPEPACGPSCGDGHADACSSETRPLRAEDCDGPDLRGASCTSLGYGAGALGCDDSCHFDRRACDDCPSGSACIHPFDAVTDVTAVALGVNGDALGVAYLSGAGAGAMLRFGELDDDGLLREPSWGMPVPNAISVDLAPGPAAGEWVLAASALRYATADASQGNTLTLVALEGSGTRARAAEFEDRSSVLLVARPGAMPLLVYDTTDSDGSAMWGQVPGVDGHTGTEPFVIAQGDDPNLPLHACAGVFASDRFWIATEQSGQEGSSMQLVQVSTRGSVERRIGLGLAQIGHCSLAADAENIRLVYEDVAEDGVALDSAVFWRALAPDGSSVAQSRLTEPDGQSGDFRALAFGTETVVLRAPDPGGELSTLSLVTLDDDGNVLDDGAPLTQVPHIGSYDAVRWGSDTVVAWVGQPPTGDAEGKNAFGRLTLTRVVR